MGITLQFKEDVLKEIENIKSSCNAKNPVYEFTHGGCLIFAMKLKEKFPQGQIIYLIKEYHFVFKMGKVLYDVTGNVTKKYKECKNITFNEFLNRNKLVGMFNSGG